MSKEGNNQSQGHWVGWVGWGGISLPMATTVKITNGILFTTFRIYCKLTALTDVAKLRTRDLTSVGGETS